MDSIAASEYLARKHGDLLMSTWPHAAAEGAVKLPLGHFANVIDVGGGLGVALTTDGVGSKAIVAELTGRYDTIGVDCVAANANDLLCVGARPISMVDYVAVREADPAVLDGVALGLVRGAIEAGVSIVGGETSVLVDQVNGLDLVGTALGMVRLGSLVTGERVRPGDVLVGLASDGIHANGLTTARRVLLSAAGLNLRCPMPGSDVILGDELLRPTAIYVREVLKVKGIVEVLAVAHVTGGGLANLSRVHPGLGVELNDMPAVPRIMELVRNLGQVGWHEMYSTFNMGVGMTLTVQRQCAPTVIEVLRRAGRAARVIGRVVEGEGVYLVRQGVTLAPL